MDYDRGGGGGYGYSSQGAARGSAIRGPSMERGASSGYGQQPSGVGIAPVFRGQPPPSSMHRDEYGNGGQYGATQSSYASPATGSGGIGRGAGSSDARSAQINEYVAKQKAAKQNAPFIRKVRQQQRRNTIHAVILLLERVAATADGLPVFSCVMSLCCCCYLCVGESAHG